MVECPGCIYGVADVKSPPQSSGWEGGVGTVYSASLGSKLVAPKTTPSVATTLTRVLLREGRDRSLCIAQLKASLEVA